MKLIEKYIFPNQRIEIDFALCLGLGRFSKGVFRRLRFLCGSHSDGDNKKNVEKRLRIWDCEFDTSFKDEGESEGEEDDSTNHEMNKDDTLTRDAGAPNSSLYQLLLFETVLKCLRTSRCPPVYLLEKIFANPPPPQYYVLFYLTCTPQGSKFRIPHSLIQNPAFTAADRAFLTNRGYTVLPYPPRLFGRGDGFPLNPSLLPRISNRTFFIAPALDLHVAVNMLLAAKPLLYWGHDMCLNVAYHISYIIPICSFPHRVFSRSLSLSCSIIPLLVVLHHFIIDLRKQHS